MKRILVVGCSGVGKSTLSLRLGEHFGLPVTHLDAYYWKPGWAPSSESEWESTVAELTADPFWIQDGNYGSTLPLRLPHADLVVFLDMPRWRCIYRVTKRRFVGMVHQIPGCDESIDFAHYRYLWRFPKAGRKRLIAHLGKCNPKKTRTVVLRNPRQVREFSYDPTAWLERCM